MSELYSRRLPTVRQLQYFLAVCEENGFHKAAIKLGISQPPLSLQIKELEEKLSVSLFLRNTQRIQLTKEGEVLKKKTESLLKELDSISKLFSGDLEKVKIGMTKTLGFEFIPKFKKFIQENSKYADIYMENYTSKELLVEIEKGSIDLAITSNIPGEEKLYRSVLIHKESLVLALPNDHPACMSDFVSLNEVHDLPLYWFNRHQNPDYYDQCEKTFRKLTFPLVRKPELADTLSMLLDVSLGKGMLLLPLSKTIITEVTGVIYKRLERSIEEQLIINIYLTWKKEHLDKDLFRIIINHFCDETSNDNTPPKSIMI